MFNHKSFATEGLFPGLVTHRSIANLGSFEFEIELILLDVEGSGKVGNVEGSGSVVPPIITPEGGGGGLLWEPARFGTNKYKVRIRITRKDKTWEYETDVSQATAKVLAKMLQTRVEKPTVSISNISMVENVEPKIKVTVK